MQILTSSAVAACSCSDFDLGLIWPIVSVDLSGLATPISSGKFTKRPSERLFLKNLLFLKTEQRGRSHRAINPLKSDFCGGSRGRSVFVKPLKLKPGTCSHQKLQTLTTIQGPLETSPCVKHVIFITSGIYETRTQRFKL